MKKLVEARLYPVFAVAAVLMCVAIGCDSNVTGPSADASSSSGATLTGTFQSAPSSFRASRALNEDNLTVVVKDSNGDEITTVNVVNGRFTIRGLPEEFTLHFMDGTTELDVMEFTDVKPNQEVDLVLSYDGTIFSVLDVKITGIDHQAGAGIEIQGTIDRISDTPTEDWAGTLEVNKNQIGVRTAQTSIREGNRAREFADLRVGNQVHVRGVFEEDANGVLWVFAHEIKLQEEEEDDDTSDDKVTLCHIPPGNPDNRKTKTVSADAVAAHLAHGDHLGACGSQ